MFVSTTPSQNRHANLVHHFQSFVLRNKELVTTSPILPALFAPSIIYLEEDFFCSKFPPFDLIQVLLRIRAQHGADMLRGLEACVRYILHEVSCFAPLQLTYPQPPLLTIQAK